VLLLESTFAAIDRLDDHLNHPMPIDAFAFRERMGELLWLRRVVLGELRKRQALALLRAADGAALF